MLPAGPLVGVRGYRAGIRLPTISIRGALTTTIPPPPVPPQGIAEHPLRSPWLLWPVSVSVSRAITVTVPPWPAPEVLLLIWAPWVSVDSPQPPRGSLRHPHYCPSSALRQQPTRGTPGCLVPASVIVSCAITVTVPPGFALNVSLLIWAPPISIKVPASTWSAPAGPLVVARLSVLESGYHPSRSGAPSPPPSHRPPSLPGHC